MCYDLMKNVKAELGEIMDRVSTVIDDKNESPEAKECATQVRKRLFMCTMEIKKFLKEDLSVSDLSFVDVEESEV
jgi:hypothetical protein